ncbi:MAG TPA: hypothetical protein VG603_12710, partial [Chitinophagales bacterium]|nr:hypothetical protein [Chitinophagales bacterium]
DVTFCTHVDSLGHCQGKATEFKWNGDKMKLSMLISNKDGLQTTLLSYKVFAMKNDHDGDLFAELSSKVHTTWHYVVRNVFFFKPGYYKVDVYTKDYKLVATQFITITGR